MAKELEFKHHGMKFNQPVSVLLDKESYLKAGLVVKVLANVRKEKMTLGKYIREAFWERLAKDCDVYNGSILQLDSSRIKEALADIQRVVDAN